MASSVSVLFAITFISIILLWLAAINAVHAAPGRWQLLQKSVGVSAMHMQLLKNDRVVLFDRTNFGRSQLNLTDGKCRPNQDLMVKPDCTAHSVEYDVKGNTYRPLMILTDTWCSSGAVTPDGRLVQTGGWRDGERGVRLFQPCSTCDWNELGNKLNNPRWYASNHILPNGQIIIVGGLGQYNYEFYPKNTPDTQGAKEMPFLLQTLDGGGSDNNLYPFVFLSPDGNLFIFANNRAILFNYKSNTVVRTYPTIPGGQPRCYPSTGSAVLLPLKNIDSDDGVQAEVLVCGGAPKGSLQQANNGNFLTALDDCGRLRFTDPDPQWSMETMPMARVMGDMLLLPNGDVMIINGCNKGTAGWELCRDDIRTPVMYKPDGKPGSRFETQAESEIPRVYHSTAICLRDGRVLVGGSNTHFGYEFGPGVRYPTLLSLEAFSPWYIGSNLRPMILDPARVQLAVKYSQVIPIIFSLGGTAVVNLDSVKVTMLSPSFNTHSFSQGQRMLELTIVGKPVPKSTSTYEVTVRMPISEVLMPPIYCMMFVVHQGAPSVGKWVKISR